MSKKMLIVVIIALFAGLSFSDSKPQKPTAKTYGSVIVDKVLAIEDGFILSCNINQWPAVIGRNIRVRVNAVESPSKETDKPEEINKLKTEIKKFMQTTLKKSKVIILRNIKRGKTFSLVADVIVDANSLADLMIDKGLANRTDIIDTPGEKQPAAIVAETPEDTSGQDQPQTQSQALYLASKNSKVFHYYTCRSIRTISPENIVEFADKDQALETGKRPCRICKP